MRSPSTTTDRCLAVCGTAHAGGAELCTLINGPEARVRADFFEPAWYASAAHAWGTPSLPDYVARLLATQSAPGRPFAFELHWDHYCQHFESLDIRDLFPGLEAVFVTREDRLGQAIEQVWNERVGSPEGSLSVYDGDRIQGALARSEEEEQRWEELFRASGLQVIRVSFEEVTGNPEARTDLTARLGCELTPKSAERSPRRLPPAELAADWRARFAGARSGGTTRWRKRLPRWLRGTPNGTSPKRYGFDCREHNWPDQLKAGSTFGARVCLQNTSGFVWQTQHPQREGSFEPGDIVLAVHLDGEWKGTHKLPRAAVGPGESVWIQFAFEVPEDRGRHTLELDLIEWEVAHFRDHARPTRIRFDVDEPDNSPAASLWRRAKKVNPWLLAPTQGISRSDDGGNYPVFLERAKGCRVWDVAGNEYVDYMMGNGSALLGHGEPRVMKAAQELLERTGPLLQLPHPLEIEVSEMLVEDIPCAEMVTFGKNGSDVCTVVGRLARAHTGKNCVLFRGYHGWQDFWVEQGGYADGALTPRSAAHMIEFPYNDREAFRQLFDRHRADLAAIMVEPSPWGGDYVGCEEDDPSFLQLLREAADEAGALLIFDEIVTGYRVRGGSVQKASGVIPDLACAGKAIASGLPLAAAVGRAEVMGPGLPRIFYPGPTFRGEVLALAAARATIEIYRAEPVAQHVHDYGTRLAAGIDSLCRELGVDGRCAGPPYRMMFVFGEPEPERFLQMRTLFVQELLKRGVTSFLGLLIPSYAHDEAALKLSLEAFGGALEQVADAARKDEIERRLEIPPVYFG